MKKVVIYLFILLPMLFACNKTSPPTTGKGGVFIEIGMPSPSFDCAWNPSSLNPTTILGTSTDKWNVKLTIRGFKDNKQWKITKVGDITPTTSRGVFALVIDEVPLQNGDLLIEAEFKSPCATIGTCSIVPNGAWRKIFVGSVAIPNPATAIDTNGRITTILNSIVEADTKSCS